MAARAVLGQQLRALHPDSQAASREGLACAFEMSKPTLSDTHPPAKPRLLVRPYSSSTGGLSVQVYEPLGINLIQTTTMSIDIVIVQVLFMQPFLGEAVL